MFFAIPCFRLNRSTSTPALLPNIADSILSFFSVLEEILHKDVIFQLTRALSNVLSDVFTFKNYPQKTNAIYILKTCHNSNF